MKPTVLTSIALLVCCVSASAQSPTTPAPGSKVRKAVLDAVRVPIQKSLKGRAVVFKVDWIKATDTWCFVKGVPQQPNGQKMDYRGTQYQMAMDDGIFDDWFCALLKKSNGKWIVKAWQVGATDVAWDGWHDQFKAPKALFPYPK